MPSHMTVLRTGGTVGAPYEHVTRGSNGCKTVGLALAGLAWPCDAGAQLNVAVSPTYGTTDSARRHARASSLEFRSDSYGPPGLHGRRIAICPPRGGRGFRY